MFSGVKPGLEACGGVGLEVQPEIKRHGMANHSITPCFFETVLLNLITARLPIASVLFQTARYLIGVSPPAAGLSY